MINIDFLNREISLSSLHFDSRSVEQGSLFVAIKGTVSDGHDYIDVAIERGATTIVCEKLPSIKKNGVEYIVCQDTTKALAELASKVYDNPSSKLQLVGVTGTNGKTTTATLLYDLFTSLGYKCGLISTVVNKVAGKDIASTHTTPDSLALNLLISQMVEQGCQYCFMEVSSHSIVQHRIAGLTFAGGLFTNITLDHLDYHGTFANYIAAKKGFFDNLPKESFALYNSDDRNGEIMVQNCKASKKSFTLRTGADYRCKIIESLFGGMLLEIDDVQVWVNFIGGFNAHNLLGVYAVALELGADKQQVLTLLSSLKSVAGRFDYTVSSSGVVAIVDYAHTPDALQNVIDTINEIRTPNQRLITLVGCGGNRDKSKRPIMAQIAVENSSFAILTSDNPRFEEPGEILKDMCEGVKTAKLGTDYLVMKDREEAIGAAVAMAKGVDSSVMQKGGVGDIILIAGKGHENYQDIKGVKHHFDDREVIKELFAK